MMLGGQARYEFEFVWDDWDRQAYDVVPFNLRRDASDATSIFETSLATKGTQLGHNPRMAIQMPSNRHAQSILTTQ